LPATDAALPGFDGPRVFKTPAPRPNGISVPSFQKSLAIPFEKKTIWPITSAKFIFLSVSLRGFAMKETDDNRESGQ
jgi:hypothetical protein